MKVAVIGGGAAGFFSAISCKENHPQASVTIFEKSQKLLSKVKISGGGRCNVTNGCTNINELHRAYPRGGKKLKQAFHTFSTQDTMNWFESRGVPLYTQEDTRVFPVSNNSQSIIDCLISETQRLGIRISKGTGIESIKRNKNDILLEFTGSKMLFDKVIVASGGSPKRSGLAWLEDLGHKVEEPLPSLFTFNMPKENITKLMGLVVDETITNIQGTKLRSNGPLLITHWGMSGPAILKLSAFGARELNKMNYNFTVQINWVNEANNDLVLSTLKDLVKVYGNKIVYNQRPYDLPKRLWNYILERCEIQASKKWSDVGKKSLNKLMTVLSNDQYPVSGKTTFKEEFVTCGGISLESVDFKTMQSKVIPNLYFAGEVMDIDAITGGYNFQAAWTTAFIAGKLM